MNKDLCKNNVVENSEKKNSKKKPKMKFIIIGVVIIIIGLVTLLITFEEKKEQEKIKFQEKFNYTWYNETGFELNIWNLNLGSCSYSWRGMSDFLNVSNCKIELDEKNKNLKLTYTLKITDNGESEEQNVEKYLKYDDNVTKLILQNETDEEKYTFTKEDSVQEFDKDYHDYYITNTGAYLRLYPSGLCKLDLSSLTKTHSLSGSYSGVTLNVVYNTGNCSYTTTNYKDFVIKYDGTFTAVMIPGGDLYRNKKVVSTDNNEIHISFDDDDVAYQHPKYMNGEWEIGSITYYKAN
jgi:hypothetical protein